MNTLDPFVNIKIHFHTPENPCELSIISIKYVADAYLCERPIAFFGGRGDSEE